MPTETITPDEYRAMQTAGKEPETHGGIRGTSGDPQAVEALRRYPSVALVHRDGLYVGTLAHASDIPPELIDLWREALADGCKVVVSVAITSIEP